MATILGIEITANILARTTIGGIFAGAVIVGTGLIIDAVEPNHTKENVTYDFRVNVISGSLKGRQFKGSFSYDPSMLKGKGQETIKVQEVEFNYLSKYTGQDGLPEVAFTDGKFERLIWVSGKSTERFGFNAGFRRVQFGRLEEAFIRNGKDYFGYLDEYTFVDGAGTITYTPR